MNQTVMAQITNISVNLSHKGLKINQLTNNQTKLLELLRSDKIFRFLFFMSLKAVSKNLT